MRRWMRWTLGVVLALTVLAAILVVLAPNAAPFPFLRGHKAVQVEYSPAQLRQWQEERRYRRVYSFPADYHKLLPVVERDVAAGGLRYAVPPGFWSANTRLYQPEGPPDFQPVDTNYQVWMYRDARATGKGDAWDDKAGWVTFIVDLPQPPSLIDNLRSWLGL